MSQPPDRWVLVAVSTAQLAAGVAGNLVALRERKPFDIALVDWRGQPERMARDSWLFGTGLSAPIVILIIQALATGRLATRPSTLGTQALAVLGGAMAGGYLIEGEFRKAVSPSGWHRVVSPIAAAGFVLAFGMAALGVRTATGTENPPLRVRMTRPRYGSAGQAVFPLTRRPLSPPDM
jgi:hypothetical protein